MIGSTQLEALRRRNYALASLPEQIHIPATGARGEIAVRPIEEATLDEVAFAMRAVEAEFNAVADRLHALRRLYAIAREAGALGAELAVEAVSRGGER